MSIASQLTAAERRHAEHEKAITNREHLAWAKKTLARYPNRSDLRELIAKAVSQ